MAVISQTELGEALGTNNFEIILDTPESNWIDFKSEPYESQPPASGRLSPYGQSELCKDVAAFANSSGGCIVIGYRTTRDPTQGIETAISFSFIANDLVSISSYRSAIKSGIYPLIREPNIRWYNPSDSESGILLIEIPAQSNDLKPYMLRRVVDGDVKFEGVSIPTRNGDATDWHTPEKIHADILAGRISPIYTNPVASTLSFETPANILEDVEGQKNWISSPIFWLQAYPSRSFSHIQQFFGADGLANKLQNFPSLRTNGFNLRVFGLPEYAEGNMIYGSRDDAYLRLESTGIFTLGIVASPHVIGWGLRHDPSLEFAAPVVVNGTVVVEETVEFCRFVHSELSNAIENTEWTYRLTCERFRTNDIRIGSGAPRLYMHLALSTSYRSSSDSWVREVRMGQSVARDSMDIMTNFYSLFNLGADSIPHTKGDGIDIDAFRVMTG